MTEKPYKPISDEKIESRLLELPKEIFEAQNETTLLKIDWLNAKLNYKRNLNLAIAQVKAEDMKRTQTDVMAIAEEKVADEVPKVIAAEMMFRNAQAKAEELRNGLFVLSGVSNHRRASAFQQQSVRVK